MSIWDDPELHTGDNFFSFNNVGDTLQGRIEIIKKQVWADGTSSPQLFITDATTGEEVVLSAGQIQLKNKLVAERPDPGDDIWIRFTQVENRGGGKTLKHFDVRVKRNNAGPGYRPQSRQQAPGQGFGGAPQQAAAAGWQQPAQQPGPQPPVAQPAAQPQLPNEDPWATPQPAQQTQGGYGNPGEPPF